MAGDPGPVTRTSLTFCRVGVGEVDDFLPLGRDRQLGDDHVDLPVSSAGSSMSRGIGMGTTWTFKLPVFNFLFNYSS